MTVDASAPSMAEEMLARLARHACGLQLSQVPPEVVQQGRLSILDTIGCMVSGADVPETQRLLQAEIEACGGGGDCSVVGHAVRLPPAAAARVNGYAGDIFELNDLTGGHASIAVVTASLAGAESLGATGAQLLEAVIVGIELTSRVYAAYYPTMKPYAEVGITPPGIPSTIGATASLAKLAGLGHEQTAAALSMAGALAGWCPAEVIFGDGGTVKPLLFGSWPASVALQAIAYARHGFSGPPRLLESPIGLYATLARSFDARAALEPGIWYLGTPRRKRHACCGYIHSALDGLIRLRAAGADVRDAAVLEVRMPGYILPGVSKAGDPASPNAARFHAEYCIALVANGADLILPAHSLDLDHHLPGVKGLMQRIRVVADTSLSHYHQSIVRGLDASGGESFVTHVHAPRGAPGDPMSDDEVRSKFAGLVRASIPDPELQQYQDRMDSLQDQPDCRWILQAFGRKDAR